MTQQLADVSGSGDEAFDDGEKRPALLPLTPAQRGMWFADRLSPDYSVNIAQYIDIRHEPGGLDIDLLMDCSYEVGRELETPYIRLTEVDGIPMQYVDVDYDQKIDLYDFRDRDDPLGDALDWVQAEYRRPMDLINDQLIVIAIIKVADDHTILYQRAHHLIIDGYAALTNMKRVLERYNAARRGEVVRAKPAATLSEIIEYEDDYRSSTRREADRDHWVSRVADLPERVTLARSAVQAPLSFDNVVAGRALEPGLQTRLTTLAGELNTSLAVLMVSAFGALLARMTGSDDIALSLPITGRANAKIKRSGGMVSNVVPIRLRDISAKTGRELVGATLLELTGALRHQRYRSDDIRRDAGLDGGSMSFGPTINMVFFDEALTLDGAELEYRILASGVLEDLLINLYQQGPGSPVVVDLHGNPHLYGSEEMRGHLDRFLAFLERFAVELDSSISDLDTLLAGETEVLSASESGLAIEWTDELAGRGHLLDLFCDRVAEAPDAPAVVDGERIWSYGEFDRLRRDLATRMATAGVGAGDRVAIDLARGVDQVAAVYAVLSLGAAYVPVDPELPAARRQLILNVAEPLLVVDVQWLSESGFRTEPPAEDATPTVPVLGGGGAPAYVIFTSGSTGTPKGVQVSHTAVLNRLAWVQDSDPTTAADVWMYKTPATFDPSVVELLSPLQRGAVLVIAAPGGHRDPGYLRDLIDRRGVTVMHFVPSMLDAFADSAPPGDPVLPSSLRRVFASGEALSAAVAARAVHRSAADLVNLYGPTEAAVDVTRRVIDAGETTMPIGRVVPNTTGYVLDARLRRVPFGVPGELYLGGVQLADGYVAAAGLTADRFVADSFAAGSRMYRTGDLVRWSPTGELEYLGRTDFQVKIRGQRVELGEIEQTLAVHDEVESAVAVYRDDLDVPAVVAYVRLSAAARSAEGAVDELGRACARQLPGHMVPAAIVVVDEFPTTPSGKLDRRALPEPEFRTAESVEYVNPGSPVERAIADLIEELLGVERVGMRDNLFRLGADSLAAARLAARARAVGLNLDLSTILESQDIAELAVAARNGADRGAVLVLKAGPRPSHVPLSYPQTRLWILNRVDPAAGTYNVPGAVRLPAELDSEAMRAAVGDVLARHESLRTTFPTGDDDEPHQLVHPFDDALLGHILQQGEIAAADLDERLAQIAAPGFDLVSELPVRIGMLTVVENHVVTGHVLAVVMHHIVSDGASLGPLVEDVLWAYAARTAGRAPDWMPLPVQYADYTLWHRRVLGDADDPDSRLAQQIEFWRRELDGLPEIVDLPLDRPRPPSLSGAGAFVDTGIDAAAVASLRTIAAERGSTLFTVFQAVTAAAIGRFARTDDIALGTAVSGRDDVALHRLIGMFVNTVVLRHTVLPSMTFGELLDSAQRVRTRALSNADVPFDQIVDVLGVPRTRDHSPLFQVSLVMQRDEIRRHLVGYENVELIDARVPAAKFDLAIGLVEYGEESDRPGEVSVEFNYAIDLFERRTIERFAAYFTRVVGALASGADPVSRSLEDLFAFERTDLEEVLTDSVGSLVELPPETLADAAAAQVAATPEATALVFGEQRMDYAEFGARVNGLARVLIRAGVGPEVAVGIALPRSAELLVGVHAVIAAGGQFVPLDAALPAERVTDMCETGEVAVVLTPADPAIARPDGIPDGVLRVDVDTAGPVSDGHPIEPAERRGALGPDNAAYTLFTSGSTGRPKGVTVRHRSILNRLRWMQGAHPMRATDVALQKTPITFDVSVPELFGPLMAGATLVVAEPGRHGDPEYLADLVERERVTVIHFVPSMLATYAEALGPERVAGLRSLRLFLTSGEALTAASANAILHSLPGVELVNLYGPTEAAVEVTAQQVHLGAGAVPIGRPVWNTTTYVLDSQLRPLPRGVPGELYLGGVQVARGYAEQPGLTAERFVADPHGNSGERLYRTGDLVKWNSRGEIEYLGRNDFQVKLRGQRLELGEIESVLAAVPGVVHVAATVRDLPSGEQLVAYLSPDSVDLGLARTTAAEFLPEYMRPTVWMTLPEIGLNTAGKVDRKALPDPVMGGTEYVGPRTDTEAIVAGVFADVLGVERVSVTESFFELGGNSLSATKVVARLSTALERRVPVAAIFEAPSVAGLVALVNREKRSHQHRPALVPRLSGDRGPLSTVQRGMWLINRAVPDSPVYNVAMALHLDGELDREALRVAAADVCERHESLRTRYPMHHGEPIQEVMSPGETEASVEYRVIGASADLGEVIAEVTGRGFDLTTAPPVRMAVLERAPREHVLVVVIHHIAADGASTIPLARDLMAFYRARITGDDSGLPPLEVQYLDFALWQEHLLDTVGDDAVTERQRQLDYWVSRLTGAPTELALPLDRQRPPTPSYEGGEVRFDVDAELVARLESVAQSRETTLFMVMQSAFAVLLGRLTSERDIVIGTPYGGRDDAALDDLVGDFVNTLALRTTLRDDESFEDLLARVCADDLADMDHADVAFDSVVDSVLTRIPTAYNPIYQVMFAFQNFYFPSVELPGLTVTPISEHLLAAKVDLQLTLFPNDPSQNDPTGSATPMRGQLLYATDVLDADTVQRYARRYVRVLEEIADNPSRPVGDISIMIEGDRDARRVEDEERPISLSVLVAEAAAVDPRATAVRTPEAEVSFAELSSMTSAMAAMLPDEDAAMTAALVSLVPGLSGAGPDGLGEVLDQLRESSKLLAT